MDPSFWHDRWDRKQIGFHQSAGNPLLKQHLPALGLAKGARIFLPLCGKTGDIGWLLAQGFRVAGAELSRIAVTELFNDLNITPDITQGALTRFHAPGIDIFVGDLFDLTADKLGDVDAVYDRAALVALPKEMRANYAPHMVQITHAAPQLLIAFDYDASTVSGPPFPVPLPHIADLYSTTYAIQGLADNAMTDGLKGVTPAREQVWHLTPL